MEMHFHQTLQSYYPEAAVVEHNSAEVPAGNSAVAVDNSADIPAEADNSAEVLVDIPAEVPAGLRPAEDS